MFFKKNKLKKEFDQKLISLMRSTNEEWHQSIRVEELLDDYDLDVMTERKMAESRHFFLFKEAKIRKISLK
ncbi:YaaL family protein [Paenisporosarcina cavernae]|uniref:DUF2508 family protein n=1 Tax=Paenisporosarcina cavernae TaxID=2320858 RepID=A0A385YQT6_9BACL|nr:YaaL family protein [Paenisporosarcina cavernae]AYC28357.1 DUF2508 family protein [Paenisporosarcina cavernae]AYC30720.1 DUF2508 family protein [Paenisporosarcina cavernae]